MAVAIWQQMQDRRAELEREQDEILTVAQEAGEFSEEQRTRLAELNTSVERLTNDIHLAYNAERRAAGLPPGDPDRPAVTLPSGPEGSRQSPAPFASLGDQLMAVVRSAQPGAAVDPRLMELQAAALGASAGVPSDGGFLIQSQFSDALVARAVEQSQVFSLCDNIEIGEGADSLEEPMIDESSRADGSRWGGVQAYWADEAESVTASKPKFRQNELRLEELKGICYATNRSLRDARSLEQVIRNAFASEFAFKLDDAVIRGDGAGKPLGIIADACAATVSVAKETGQPAATIVVENISKMWARLHARVRNNAVWFINQEIEPQLDQLAIAAGTGALEPRVVTYAPDGVIRIKGRPVRPIEQCSALGTKGDIIVGAMSEYRTITKGGLEAATSVHVQFVTAETAFRFILFVNGQPKWATVITPYKGAGTLAPFVTLATRA